MSEIYTFVSTRRRFGVSRFQTGKHQALMRGLTKSGRNVIALPEIEHHMTLPALKPVNNANPFLGSKKRRNRNRQVGRNQASARNQCSAKFSTKLRTQVFDARTEW
jgi:hypothetical protein